MVCVAVPILNIGVLWHVFCWAHGRATHSDNMAYLATESGESRTKEDTPIIDPTPSKKSS